MNASMDHLPEDLIDPILSYLPHAYSHDLKASLLSCSLVSAKFRKYALPRLFRQIRVQYYPRPYPRHSGYQRTHEFEAYTLEAFFRFLLDHPNIASFIHHLTLESCEFETEPDALRDAIRIVSKPFLCSLLSKLPSLQHLYLRDVLLDGHLDSTLEELRRYGLNLVKPLDTVTVDITGFGASHLEPREYTSGPRTFGPRSVHVDNLALPNLLSIFSSIGSLRLHDLANVRGVSRFPDHLQISGLFMSSDAPVGRVLRALCAHIGQPLVKSLNSIDFDDDVTESDIATAAAWKLLVATSSHLKHLGLGLLIMYIRGESASFVTPIGRGR
jgi:hypothetical protein